MFWRGFNIAEDRFTQDTPQELKKNSVAVSVTVVTAVDTIFRKVIAKITVFTIKMHYIRVFRYSSCHTRCL